MAKKKYGTLDEALTAGTGMKKVERKKMVKDVNYWLDVRNANKPDSKKYKEATAKIEALLGW